jgi:signal transduction histidine kinase
MRERAELIGGTLQIQSVPGKGTAVTLLLPAKPTDPSR